MIPSSPLATAHLTGPSLIAWTAHALGYQNLAFQDDELLSPDPEEPGCAYDTHHYLRGNHPESRVWGWWLRTLAPGDGIRAIAPAPGLAFEVVLGDQRWNGNTLSEALCRALVAHHQGPTVPSVYPWGHEQHPARPPVA